MIAAMRLPAGNDPNTLCSKTAAMSIPATVEESWRCARGHTYPMPVDRDAFFQIMSAFPTGVAIVTTLDSDGVPRGLTTNAVTSVSAEPPILARLCRPQLPHAAGASAREAVRRQLHARRLRGALHAPASTWPVTTT